MRFIPTGGIGAANLADYLAVPSVLACGGSWICERTLLATGRFDEVERLAREAVEPSHDSARDPRPPTSAATTSSRSAR